MNNRISIINNYRTLSCKARFSMVLWLSMILIVTFAHRPVNVLAATSLPSDAANKPLSDAQAGFKLPIDPEKVYLLTYAGEDYEHVWWSSPSNYNSDLPENKKYGGFAPVRNANSIKNMVDYINSYTKIRLSTSTEIKAIGFSEVKPITFIFDGERYIHLWLMTKESKTIKTKQVTGTLYKPYMDRYIVCFEKNKHMIYYTLFSEKAPEYIYYNMSHDMMLTYYLHFKPNPTKQNPLKIGDVFEFSCIGNKENTFNFSISSSKINKDSKMLKSTPFIKVTPFIGEWKFKLKITRDLPLWNGTIVHLQKDLYNYWYGYEPKSIGRGLSSFCASGPFGDFTH